MKQFDDLVDVVKRLRAPDGCPWDREQTFQSLTPYIIEEAYELVDAMKAEDFSLLREELGDVLLHVVMLSNMAEEKAQFSVKEVAADVTEKMIRRHPHVFGDTKVNSVDDVWENWEKIKKTEKPSSTFSSIPKQLPALIKAQKVQKKAARAGFDWEDVQGPLAKLTEETDELTQVMAATAPDPAKLADELGDLLFTVVNIARKLGVDAEAALRQSTEKFVNRFEAIEERAKQQKQDLSALSADALNALWEDSKRLF